MKLIARAPKRHISVLKLKELDKIAFGKRHSEFVPFFIELL